MLRRSLLLILIAVLPLLLVAAMLLAGVRRTPTLRQALNEYVTAGHMMNTDNQLIWNIAQGFVQGTLFEDKLEINAPPQPDMVNIYVLGEDPKGYFKGIDCNCAYMGQQNMIVCDARLLEYFRQLINVPAGTPLSPDKAESSQAVSYLNSRFSLFLLQWILGHEIGHLVKGHGLSQYYFQPPQPLVSLPERGQPDPSKIERRYEQEADTFVIEHLGRQDDQVWAWLALSSVIDTMYAQALEKQHTQMDRAPLSNDELHRLIFNHQITLELTDGPDIHPPWLIRTLDMMKLLIDSSVVVDKSGYVDAARESIRLAPVGSPPLTLCRAKVTPQYNFRAIPIDQSPFGDAYRWHVRQGFEYFRLTEYDKALAEFTAGIDLMVALTANGDHAPPQLLEAYLQRGVIYFIEKGYDRAIADWKSATLVQPGDARAANNLGFAYYELDRLEEAITEWQNAVRRNPSLDDGWAGLGIALYAKGQADEAMTAYKKALAIEPRYASLEWLRYERSWTEKSLRDAAALLRRITP